MPINANVTNNQITASVGETQIDVSVSGGIGPTGPAGPIGPAGSVVMASQSVLGGVRIGSGVSIDGNGVISVSTAYAAISHAHGFLSASGTMTDGAVNSAFVSAPAVVTSSGFLRQGQFGTTSGTIAEGNHTHALSSLTQSGATTNQVVAWNGTAWAPATVSSGSSAWADITGKPATFPPSSHTHTAADIDSASTTAGYVLAADGEGGASWEQGGSPSQLTNGGDTFALDGSSAVAFTTPEAIANLSLTDGSEQSISLATSDGGAYAEIRSSLPLAVYEGGYLGPILVLHVIWPDETTFSGSYTELRDLPTLFDGDYNSLTNLPTLFDGAYGSLTGLPTLGTAAAASTSDFAAATHNHAASEINSGTLSAARLPVVLEQTVTGGNTGTSVTLSLASGSVQTWTLNGNCTFTMPTATAGASLTVILTQNGTNTATFTGVLWSGGTAPTITATANKRDILVFVSDGTNWYGTASQNH